MNRFVIAADTHGTLDIARVVDYYAGRENEFSKDNYLIICGDVGVCGFSARDEELMRGQVFNIGETTFFTFGGAFSTDRESRVEGMTWFPEEIPCAEEYEEGWHNLSEHGFAVDYIITHTGPLEAVDSYGYYKDPGAELELRQYLQRVADNTESTAWFYGHFNEDYDVDGTYFCLYEEVVTL
ncbi:hypothetical protein SAMN02910456_01703 [Ruminococcaceae bacterium YRB3002]|nr:hypothetical protein SAMN02910456_01703 [Ruminococcaceae bacterium YRB3002]